VLIDQPLGFPGSYILDGFEDGRHEPLLY